MKRIPNDNRVEELLITTLSILSRAECSAQVQIRHEGAVYVVEAVLGGEAVLATGKGRTLDKALRSLLLALWRGGR